MSTDEMWTEHVKVLRAEIDDLRARLATAERELAETREWQREAVGWMTKTADESRSGRRRQPADIESALVGFIARADAQEGE